MYTFAYMTRAGYDAVIIISIARKQKRKRTLFDTTNQTITIAMHEAAVELGMAPPRSQL